MSTAIKVENLSKAYQLGQIGTGTISKDLERWYARIRGKEDPFLKIGETNTPSTSTSNDMVWSLKDINFEIEQGDAVGIIGRNGAGKSTLLKILSKVTAPTTGKISGRGRIASLLEVGTGFHPELSGRENIFLNGAILGMRKKEIQRKLEEIVDFAGIERYLDTPVKRYSSGMYVRLAFAVAAHLESEILIVDEVLAVGDAEFQKKCLGKMGEVSKGEGRTVLFVSHNMGSIKQLCNKGLLLQNGMNNSIDKIDLAVSNYQKSMASNILISERKSNSGKKVYFEDIHLNKTKNYNLLEDIDIELSIAIKKDIEEIVVAIEILNSNNEPIAHIINYDGNRFLQNLQAGTVKTINTKLKRVNLTPGEYHINLWVGSGMDATDSFDAVDNAISFTILNGSNIFRKTAYPLHTKAFIESIWEVK